jgi:hypothetical protein
VLEDRQRAQLRVIRLVVDTLRVAEIRAWLFGGWGVDALAGSITRPHGDIEFWMERRDDEQSKVVLVQAGATALMTQPREESCEYDWNGVPFSTAYFDRRPDGTFTTQGRWSDWIFPARSFGNQVGVLDGMEVPTMSAAGMLAMKDQFPRLRNGRAWRPNDIVDLDTLRSMATQE